MLPANPCVIEIPAMRLVRLSCCASWLLFAAFAAAPTARAADANDIAEGMRIFHQKANCQACHGWAGDGRKMDAQMPDGANLRETKLDRSGLVLIMKCGLPGTGMPAFDRLAYSDGRCGRKQADLQAQGLALTDPAATLQPREIEMVADFMLAKIVGKGPMNRVKCADFWGSDADVCRELPK
jgi:mono/diheme cytochrome c family protein